MTAAKGALSETPSVASASRFVTASQRPVSVGSLCTGYGGLDMGLALALGVPLRHAWHVENDAQPSVILAARYPGVPNLGDLKTLDHSALEPVDWLTAGYPCQPFSPAGRRLGEADARHLWPYVADTIGALRPRGVLLENVRGHVSLGLDSVLADLAALGYDASWGVVRASEAGAAHQRARVFIAATDATGAERRGGGGHRPDVGPAPTQRDGRAEPGHSDQPAADPTHDRCERSGEARRRRDGSTHDDLAAAVDWGKHESAIRRWEHVLGRPAPRPTEPGRNGERLSAVFVEWLMGLPAGWVTDIDLPRSAQLKALGNGVVPQQAALAMRLLADIEAREVAA